MLKLYRICFILIFLPTFYFAQQPVLTQIVNNGPVNNKVNIVFLPDGYTQNQLSRFLNDINTKINYFFSIDPFKTYASQFNVFAISVASVDSGASHPAQNIYKNTYFSCSYDFAGIERLLTPTDDGNTRAMTLLQSFVPNYHIAIILVNDQEYGGSGGWCSVTSINSQSNEILMHELGHSFGHLTDEYVDTTIKETPVEFPNATHETTRSLIKWNKFILDSTLLPTPQTDEYSTVVGLFEGAEYVATGWYRPQLNCRMRALNFDYCKVCADAIAKNIIQISGTTNITENTNIPYNFVLSQNYPNPFNPSTNIRYTLPQESNVAIKVYDILGREVATLVDEHKSAGTYNIQFNASILSSGIYIYRIVASNFVQSKKMVLLK
jgi:hypothetical protein